MLFDINCNIPVFFGKRVPLLVSQNAFLFYTYACNVGKGELCTKRFPVEIGLCLYFHNVIPGVALWKDTPRVSMLTVKHTRVGVDTKRTFPYVHKPSIRTTRNRSISSYTYMVACTNVVAIIKT